MNDRALVGTAYGEWIAGLAPWLFFVTPTHRIPDVTDADAARAWSRVGVQHSRRALRDWFHGEVRPRSPGARAWFETELHVSGQPHHHGLLAIHRAAPWIEMRQAWYRAEGFIRFDPIEDVRTVARYVAKYATKAATMEPMVWGL